MTFDTVVKDLLKSPQRETGAVLERGSVLLELAKNGFSVGETVAELRSLYDNTEDDSLRKQLLDMIIKVHGLYKDEDKKEIPKIIFNIVAEPLGIDNMLCPTP